MVQLILCFRVFLFKEEVCRYSGQYKYQAYYSLTGACNKGIYHQTGTEQDVKSRYHRISPDLIWPSGIRHPVAKYNNPQGCGSIEYKYGKDYHISQLVKGS